MKTPHRGIFVGDFPRPFFIMSTINHALPFYVRNSIAHVTVSINTSATLTLEVIV